MSAVYVPLQCVPVPLVRSSSDLALKAASLNMLNCLPLVSVFASRPNSLVLKDSTSELGLESTGPGNKNSSCICVLAYQNLLCLMETMSIMKVACSAKCCGKVFSDSGKLLKSD